MRTEVITNTVFDINEDELFTSYQAVDYHLQYQQEDHQRLRELQQIQAWVFLLEQKFQKQWFRASRVSAVSHHLRPDLDTEVTHPWKRITTINKTIECSTDGEQKKTELE